MSDAGTQPLLHVLALDDDIAQRHVLNATLYGVARLEFCSTPEQAVAAVQAARYDVAILDVHLRRSRQDGFDVARALHEIDPALEVLLYTGDDSAEVLENALEVRALRRILKASSRGAIVNAVRECAEETRRNRRAQRDATIGQAARVHLEEQTRVTEISRTVADLYRGFFQSLANELTALGVTGAVFAALAERTQSASGASLKRMADELRQTADTNAATLARISSLVRQMTRDAGDLTTTNERTQVGLALQAVAKTFLGDARINGELRVVVPPVELVLPVSPAALVNVLRSVVGFLLDHSTPPAAATLAAELLDRAEAERLFAADGQLLALNRDALTAARYVRFHCRCDGASLAGEAFAAALEGPPATGTLYSLAHLSARFSVPVSCRQSSSGSVFELFFPAWS